MFGITHSMQHPAGGPTTLQERVLPQQQLTADPSPCLCLLMHAPLPSARPPTVFRKSETCLDGIILSCSVLKIKAFADLTDLLGGALNLTGVTITKHFKTGPIVTSIR